MKALSLLQEAIQAKLGRSGHLASATTQSSDSSKQGSSLRHSWWEKLQQNRAIRIAHPPLMLGVTVVALTGVVGYRFYRQPALSVDTLSPRTIIAPTNGNFLDEKTTEENRKNARNGLTPRLYRDQELTQSLKNNRVQFLDQINQLRKIAAPFPYLAPNQFSLEAQHQLRQLSDADWQLLQAAIQNPKSSQELPPRLAALEPLFDSQKTSAGEGRADNNPDDWLEQTQQARQRYQGVLDKLNTMSLDEASQASFLSALQLNDATWQVSEESIIRIFDRIVTQGLPAGITPGMVKETITFQLGQTLPSTANQLEQDILEILLLNKHNLTIDKIATKEQSEQAASAVPPVRVEIAAGEVIVKAGETITQSQFVLLDGFGLSRRHINWGGVFRTGLLVTGAVVVFCEVSRRVHRPLRRRDHILLCLLSLSAPVLSLVMPRYTDLPAIGLLTSSFYGPSLAITQVLLVSGLSAFAVEAITWEYWLAGTSAGILAGFFGGRLRSRDELAVLGIGVGIVQGGVYLASHLVLSASASVIWYAILPSAIGYGLVGMAWSVMAIGTSPYLERLFDVVTPIRLVELSNPNCPLLQRLARETPGTFQHTLFVACLAEAAARELRCNVELVRTGTLYHDIGKMHDPLGFIENQMGGVNKHDEIEDPYVSVEIIKKHVTEGIEMAKRYGLPQVVRDFIPEHQGKLLVSYFYFQAKETADANGNPPISEADFRYAGPIPQSRETGIVMLADSAEAALRSLKDPNPDKALGMINRIFKARWRDNQLKDSGIRYEELPIIADVFVRVWQQFHHQRIAYPKAALEPTTTS